MGLDQYLMLRDGDEKIEIGYWRKANAIQGWMDNLAVRRGLLEPGDSINTTVELPLSEFDIIALNETVRTVLETLGFDPQAGPPSDEDLGIVWEGPEDGLRFYSEEKSKPWKPTTDQLEAVLRILPPEQGFFFGSDEVDIWYIQDMYETLSILDSLDPGDVAAGKVFYTAWW